MANYYYSNSLSGLYIVPDSTWTHNPYGYGTLRQAGKLLNTPSGNGETLELRTFTENISTKPYILFGQYISAPLEANASLNLGTIVGYIPCMESNATLNASPTVIIRVVSNNGQIIRGSLRIVKPTVVTNEYGTSTSYYPRVHPISGTSSTVNAQSGDRVVVEVGTFADNTVATTYNINMYLGSNATKSDCPTGTTVVGIDTNPWISFSTPLVYKTVISNITNTSKTKISDESGVDKCTVTFTSSDSIVEWEARADGTGVGQGDLVGSWREINNKGLSIISSFLDTNLDNIADTYGNVGYSGHNATFTFNNLDKSQSIGINNVSASGEWSHITYDITSGINVDKTYLFTADVKFEKYNAVNASAGLAVQFYDNDTSWNFLGENYATVSENQDFTTISCKFFPPPGAGLMSIFMLITGDIGSSAKVTFKNPWLGTVENMILPLVDNTGDGVADGWWKDSILTCSLSSGIQSLTLNNAPDENWHVISAIGDVFVRPGQVWTIGASGRLETISGTCYAKLGMELFNTSGDWINSYSIQTTSSTFNDLILVNTMPDNVKTIKIYLVVEGTVGSTGTAFFKNPYCKLQQPIPSGTEISFDINYNELTWGDRVYRINVYGKNAWGVCDVYE